MGNRCAVLDSLKRVLQIIGFSVVFCVLRANGEVLHSSHPLVVGYLGQWGVYGTPPYTLHSLVQNGGLRLLDQINYSKAAVIGGRCSIADPEADLNTKYTKGNSVNGKADSPTSRFRGYLHQLKLLKHLSPRLKILISLEGLAADFRFDSQPQRRADFVSSCVEMFIKGRFATGISEPGIFDGIDLDWEYPQQEDADNFALLLQEFRRQMNVARPGARLTIAVGDSPKMHPGTDFEMVSRLVDEIGVMNYDYTGPWNSVTGILAPLYPLPNAPIHYGSVVESMAAYERAGVPRSKLLMGLPFYGYHWNTVTPANHGLFQSVQGAPEDLPYRAIQTLYAHYSAFRDPATRAPWLFDGVDFWTFDDPVSVAYKTSFAATRGFGGVMIWELGQDTSEAALLNAVWRSLREPMDVSLEEFRDTSAAAVMTQAAIIGQ